MKYAVMVSTERVLAASYGCCEWTNEVEANVFDPAETKAYGGEVTAYPCPFVMEGGLSVWCEWDGRSTIWVHKPTTRYKGAVFAHSDNKAMFYCNKYHYSCHWWLETCDEECEFDPQKLTFPIRSILVPIGEGESMIEERVVCVDQATYDGKPMKVINYAGSDVLNAYGPAGIRWKIDNGLVEDLGGLVKLSARDLFGVDDEDDIPAELEESQGV